ncbi:carcinoembryonic antigen-related cell adhesion molecule 5-like isoform X1 [Ictalurus furcatus]|uniref:carcinoembryonic antigen-related cell adhesion molecule 5-like isoform X1 n=1 Tax=Ictalurus furcatus TaxID=66913 RepID=UPI002350EFFC|nr:carcinoembryonic antigen-related cell adhesion molecule 5-like isoform X1 [Ictalurus furcatus]
MEFSPLAVMLLLISLIPVAHAQGSPKVVVSIAPDTHVFTGETVTLRCDVQGGGDTQWTYSWYKNNNRLTDRTTQEFRIWSVLYVHHGVYTCRGQSSDSQSSEISDAVTLTVSEKPTPTVRVNPQSSVYTGDTITLTCELQSTGWEIQWYKNNQSLHPLSTEETDTLKVTDDNDGETVYQCRARRRNYKGGYHSYYCTEFSDPVNITVRERPGAVLSVSPQNWLTEGDSVTLSCEITDSSTDWTFSWYTTVPYRDGLTQIKHNHGYIMYVELLSDSSRGSGGKYTLSPAALHHTGVYMCRGERGEPAFHTQYSNPQTLWITGESPPVSLIINPSKTQHFTNDSLSQSCEDQINSTRWRVRRYTHSERVLDCSRGSVTGSTCEISFLSTSYTGVYWCESESGENSNPVNITVHDGDVILESPVHPVTEGHPLTLRCLYRYPNSSNLRADFYKDGSVLQTQTTGEMIIRTVSESDEGFYHCKHPERGESPKSWVSVRASVSDSRASGGTVGVAVGLGFLFIALLILMILLWSYKRKKENQTSEQNQIRSGAEDSQSGHTPLQAGSENIYAAVDQTDTSGTGEAAAEIREATYAQVTKKKKTNRNNGADAEPGVDDVTYAKLEIKPMIKAKRMKEKASVGDDTVYSELKHSME